MQYNVNRCWLQGRVHGQVRNKDLSARTRITIFNLLIVESWQGHDGTREHKNHITVEILGAQADTIAKDLLEGLWVGVDGYLRSEFVGNRSFFKVRAFTIFYNDKRIQLETTNDTGGSSINTPEDVRVDFKLRDTRSDGVHRDLLRQQSEGMDIRKADGTRRGPEEK